MSATQVPSPSLAGGTLRVEHVRQSRLPAVDLANVQFSCVFSDHMLYAELADIYAKADKWADAESMLGRGLEATGGDLRIREQLEEIQLRRARM